MVACQSDHLQVAELLLSYGADLNARTVDGASAAFLAAQNGHSQLLSFLLRSCANVHAPRKVSKR